MGRWPAEQANILIIKPVSSGFVCSCVELYKVLNKKYDARARQHKLFERSVNIKKILLCIL